MLLYFYIIEYYAIILILSVNYHLQRQNSKTLFNMFIYNILQ